MSKKYNWIYKEGEQPETYVAVDLEENLNQAFEKFESEYNDTVDVDEYECDCPGCS